MTQTSQVPVFLNSEPKNSETNTRTYLETLFQQAKQISQIIAFIWRWADEDVNAYELAEQDKFNKKKHAALELKRIFERPNGTEQVKKPLLENLLNTLPKQNGTEEEQWLFEVFCADGKNNKGYVFPIFSEYEIKHYIITVNVNSINGMISDPTVNDNPEKVFGFAIPYPPRPELGEVTVTKGELGDWIDDRTQNPFASNPYIPTSCS